MSGNTKPFLTPDITPATPSRRTHLRMGRICPDCLGSGRKQIIFSGCFGGPQHTYDRDSIICPRCDGTGVVNASIDKKKY